MDQYLENIPLSETEKWKELVLQRTLNRLQVHGFKDALGYFQAGLTPTGPIIGRNVGESLFEQRQRALEREMFDEVTANWSDELRLRWNFALKHIDNYWKISCKLANTRSRVHEKFTNLLAPPYLSHTNEIIADSFFRCSQLAISLMIQSFHGWKERTRTQKVLLSIIWDNDSSPPKLISHVIPSRKSLLLRYPAQSERIQRSVFTRWKAYFNYVSSWDIYKGSVDKNHFPFKESYVNWRDRQLKAALPLTTLEPIPVAQLEYDEILHGDAKRLSQLEPMFSYRFLREGELPTEVQNLRSMKATTDREREAAWALDRDNQLSMRAMDEEDMYRGISYTNDNKRLVVLHLSHLEEKNWNIPPYAVDATIGNSRQSMVTVIDSGAAISGLINKGEVKYLRLSWTSLRPDEIPFRCVTANGQQLNILGILDGPVSLSLLNKFNKSVTYLLDSTLPKTKIFICEGLPAPLLLGLGILRELRFQLDPASDVLIQNEHVFPCRNYRQESKEDLLTADDTDMSPLSVVTPKRGSLTHQVCFVLSDNVSSAEDLQEFHSLLGESTKQQYSKGIPQMPKRMKVFPLVEQSIHPATTDRILVWIENIKDHDKSTPLLFTSTLEGDYATDYLPWEGILEPSPTTFRSIMVSNNHRYVIEIRISFGKSTHVFRSPRGPLFPYG
jgi:hypothetical protein